MNCPSFSVSVYGVFDSNVKFPKLMVTQERPVEEYELELYTVDCPGRACINGRWYPLEHGCFICAKPGHRRKSRLPFKCHYVHLQTGDPVLQSLLNGLPDHFRLWQMQEPVQIFQELLSLEPELPEDRLLLTSGICRLVSMLSHYRQPENLKKGSHIPHQKVLLSVERYVREHLGEPLSLEQLATLCNLSPAYFHGLFTRYYGKTPAKFVLDCRLTAAKAGLVSGDCSLAQLAKDCGFSSQSYFCSKFRQVTGMTPLEYRRQMLGRLQP